MKRLVLLGLKLRLAVSYEIADLNKGFNFAFEKKNR